MKKCNWIWTLQTYIHTLRCPESVGPTAAWPLRGFFISYWGLCRLLCQPPCPHVSGPFVCEVLEVINICFPSSVGEEDPADPLWPLRNPQRVEPVSAFPSLFFWFFFYLCGCLPVLTLMSDLRITQNSGYLMLTSSLELSHDDKFLYGGQWDFICRIRPPWNGAYKYCGQDRWCWVWHIRPGQLLHPQAHFLQNSRMFISRFSKIHVSVSGFRNRLGCHILEPQLLNGLLYQWHAAPS